MAIYDLRKASKIASGQRSVSLGSNNKELEKRVSNIENKLDTILTLLINKEAYNDKDRPKPISGNDSGV